MARTDNLTNFLIDVANSIRNVSGINNEILANEYDIIINNFTLSNETNLEITPSIYEQKFTPSGGFTGYNSVNISAVNSSIDANITPNHIANGVNILGVIGTLDTNGGGGGEIQFPEGTIVSFEGSTFTNAPVLNGSNFTNCAFLFSNCRRLKNISNMDTSHVTSFFNAFHNCVNLTNIPNFYTSNVVNMYGMFHYCKNITEIPDFDFSNVVNIGYMFSNCSNLLYLTNFNFPKATSALNMCLLCSNLRQVSNCNLYNTTNLVGMFRNCVNLTDIEEFYIPNAKNISSMFYGCNNLSNNSILNIVKMCINAVNITDKTLSNTYNRSPLYNTIFDNSYYTEYHEALTDAGWTY